MVLLRGVTLRSKGLLRRFGNSYCLHIEGDILVHIPVNLTDHKFPSNSLYISDMYFSPSFWMKFSYLKDRSSRTPETSDQSFITQRQKTIKATIEWMIILRYIIFFHPAVFERTQYEHCGNLPLSAHKLNSGERGAPPELRPLNTAVTDFRANCVRLCYISAWPPVVSTRDSADNKNRGICQKNRKQDRKEIRRHLLRITLIQKWHAAFVYNCTLIQKKKVYWRSAISKTSRSLDSLEFEHRWGNRFSFLHTRPDSS